MQGRTKQHHAKQFAYLGLRTRTGCNFKQSAGSIVAFPVPVAVVAIAVAVAVAAVAAVAVAAVAVAVVAVAVAVAVVAVAIRPLIGRSVLISTGVLGVIVHLGPTRRILIAVAKAVVAVAITG
ncbi:MAG: hypothetical protein ACJAXT_001057, partial [Paracoccaceae bacterium]